MEWFWDERYLWMLGWIAFAAVLLWMARRMWTHHHRWIGLVLLVPGTVLFASCGSGLAGLYGGELQNARFGRDNGIDYAAFRAERRARCGYTCTGGYPASYYAEHVHKGDTRDQVHALLRGYFSRYACPGRPSSPYPGYAEKYYFYSEQAVHQGGGEALAVFYDSDGRVDWAEGQDSYDPRPLDEGCIRF